MALEFTAFLEQVVAEGGYPADDVIRVIMPLFEQVQITHETGKVGPLDGTAWLRVNEAGFLYFPENETREPKIKWFGFVMQNLNSSGVGEGVEVVAERKILTEISPEQFRVQQMEIPEAEVLIKQPKYLPGYVCWEHHAGQHDTLSDIFSLGLILASVACGLDLNNEDDFQTFVDHRTYLFAVNSRLNPVIASAIVQMTELNRHRRAQDLPLLIKRLTHYREQPTEYDFDYQRIEGFNESNINGKRQKILNHLRNRLFEISRRNRLLYYKPTQQQVNLTLASVPAVLDYRHIKHEHLFVWHEQLADLIAKQITIPLSRYIRFEDAPYVPDVLDKIVSEDRRNKAEYGFGQLKLVLCFLRWNNLKESPEERIVSPLLLLPVELKKKKGVRDSFSLEVSSSRAEINPVLRYHLRQLYNLELPEEIDFTQTSMEKFHQLLAAQIHASEPAVTLRKIDKPQIEVIHQKARQRLEQYRRRQKLSVKSPTGYAKLRYSYRGENIQPLGLQLFLQKIKPSPSPFEGVVTDIKTRSLPQYMIAQELEQKPDKGLEKERVTYSLKGPDDHNPYLWIFDLCNITLANLNYRKMSLVSDYNQLVESDLEHPCFDRIFSLQPKILPSGKINALPIDELYTVISCDPTQALAIAQARWGESFIIQGPPGTGKSQTITNLIADFAAKGKRVLFVCEKRAAIDVVYHRLQQLGLDELCLLIHDSQTDKKGFIQSVAQTYEKFLNQTTDLEQIKQERLDTVSEIKQHLQQLERYEKTMGDSLPDIGISVRSLLLRLLLLKEHLPALTELQEEKLPTYREWLESSHVLRKMALELEGLGEDRMWSKHALSSLNPTIAEQERPLETMRQLLEKTLPLLNGIEKNLEKVADLREHVNSPRLLDNLLQVCERLRFLADKDLLDLLNPRSDLSKELERLTQLIKDKEFDLQKATEAANGWRIRLAVDDCNLALARAEFLEKKYFPWIRPSYWKLGKVLHRHYDFKLHPVKRNWTQALRELQRVHRAGESLERSQLEAQTRFGQKDIEGFVAHIEEIRKFGKSSDTGIKSFISQLRKSKSGAADVLEILQCLSDFSELSSSLKTLLLDFEDESWSNLRNKLVEIEAELSLFRELAPVIRDLIQVPPSLASVYRHLPLMLEQLEGSIAKKSLESIYRADRFFSRFDGRLLQEKMDLLQVLHKKFLLQNGHLIAARNQKQFFDHVNLSNLPASQLEGTQKIFKRSYTGGRRELENEFKKTMRFRSIRELAAGSAGKVLTDLKPVWLMSPLSVSDTLPLQNDYFDVVIFDEASQIPVEDAVPALYRARQVIVVGDEMQLPPTKFFSSSSTDDDNLLVDEDDEKIGISLEADSFLTQSALNLPSTMLGWHYRSRSEALIGYSNAAFYRGELLTIPDRLLPVPDQSEILVQASDSGDDFVDRLLERSLSFHFHPHGIYEDRKNRSEANYIAQLVRGLLLRKTGKSIGIVAFSEAQQSEIESALRRLGQMDAQFMELYEQELERQEDDQFCGLFTKNLENVQGDERDIILLSICYGFDRNRRMIMNFGPITQRGGEKRLNVIFSRAKAHMAIVSSIRYTDIKNEYNDGANNLRLFLQYAEAFSRGDCETAHRILGNLNPLAKKTMAKSEDREVVIEQISAALIQRGYRVNISVGQSRFRCDLAVRHPYGNFYSLGIFIDSEERISSSGLFERTVLQPNVLNSFGWSTVYLLTKDWYHDPDIVLERLERFLPAPALLH